MEINVIYQTYYPPRNMNFKNTDIVVLMPIQTEFPIYRKFLIDHHKLFGKIVCVLTYNKQIFTEPEKEFAAVLQTEMPFAHFIWCSHTEIPTDESIISHPTHLGLNECRPDAEAILFMEPDVIIENFDAFLNLPQDTYDVISLLFCDRLHPSFFWVKKILLDQTPKKFTYGTFPNITVVNNPNNNIPLKDRLVYYNDLTCEIGQKLTSELIALTDKIYCFSNGDLGFFHQGNVNLIVSMYNQMHHHNRDEPYLKEIINSEVWERFFNLSINCNIPKYEPYINGYREMREMITIEKEKVPTC